MSSESDFIASLTLMQMRLYKFGGPLLIISGSISSILSSVVFSKKSLRKNPCSIYYIAYNIASLVILYTAVLSQTLARGFHIDPSTYSLLFCRFRLYATLLADVVGPTYLILASVDRVLLTSRNARTRQRSTPARAYAYIGCATSFWLLSLSHTLVLGSIIPMAPGFNLCYFQLGNYHVFVSYYSATVKAVLIPVCMIILGLWAVRNVRSVVRVAPASISRTNTAMQGMTVRTSHPKDHQLLRILLIDVSVYLIFSLMLSVELIYQQIIPDSGRNAADTQSRIFMVVVASFSCYIPASLSFYIHLLSSKSFRKEAKEILVWK